MLGIKLLSISTILTLLLLGPPALGAGYAILTSRPQPVFMPKDLMFKAAYGATWGFWTFWQFVRPVAGMTGGAQEALKNFEANTITAPDTEEELNQSAAMTSVLGGIVGMANAFNATSYYYEYANSFGVDLNQTWQFTLFIVTNDGSCWLARFDAVWQTQPLAMLLSVTSATNNSTAPNEVTPHYGVVITIDTVNLYTWLTNGQTIDWAKVSANVMQTFYKGNVQAWTIKS